MDIKPEIQIFPMRLLSEKTALPLIDRINNIESVTKVEYKGFNSQDREDFRIGWIWVELSSEDEAAVEAIKGICTEHLPFGYDIKIGRFTKYRATTSDYLRGHVKEE